MMYLSVVTASLILLGGFVVLVGYESRRGVRFFADRRSQLDVLVTRLAFIYTHIDFSAFFKSELRRLIARTSHAAATSTLTFVRAAERFLTRVVRSLRIRQTVEARPRVSAREFVRTLSEFKGQLQVARPVHERTSYTIS